jgi:hypothetical protein
MCIQSMQVITKIVLLGGVFYDVISRNTVATADTYETKITLGLSL